VVIRKLRGKEEERQMSCEAKRKRKSSKQVARKRGRGTGKQVSRKSGRLSSK